jgi:hypothetical protein
VTLSHSLRRPALVLGALAGAALAPSRVTAQNAPADAPARDSALTQARGEAPAAAPTPLVTDRPDFTESPLVVPARSVQLEAGNSFTRAGGATERTLGEVLLRVGLHPRVELRLAANSWVVSEEAGVHSSGLEDAGVGAKVSNIPERSGRHLLPTTALLVGTSLPTGSQGRRSAALSPEAKLALGWSLAETWGLTSNLNVSSAPEAGARTTEYVGSLSLGHELGERVGAYAEVYGGRTSRGVQSRFGNVGVTFAVAPLFQLDARVGVGAGPSAGERFAGVGLSRRW